ncbi:MAG TPA: hypothetical protein VIK60_01805 [Vicinamibacterales bacterium]
MRIYQITAWRGGMFALALVFAAHSTAVAQWLSLPLPGTPRTADGKPNLSAPAPRTADGKPDHSGIWRLNTSRHNPNANLLPKGTEAPMLPWAAELYKRRVATHGYDRPMTVCLPHGVPDGLTSPYGFKLVQTPNLVVHLYEEFTMHRQIHTDGRPLPVDPNPQYYGYSIGRWEGETLVVETAGFKEGSWLDNDGHPHTEALRTTERFRRINFGSMEVDVTIDDPKAYSRPWTAETMRLVLQPDTELLEHLCENNRDLERLQQIWQDRQPAAPPTTGRQ